MHSSGTAISLINLSARKQSAARGHYVEIILERYERLESYLFQPAEPIHFFTLWCCYIIYCYNL